VLGLIKVPVALALIWVALAFNWFFTMIYFMIIIFDITRTRAVLHIGKRVLYENSRPNLPQLTVAAGPAMIANASPIVTPTAEAE